MDNNPAKKPRLGDLTIDMEFNESFTPSNSKRNATKSIYDGAGRIRMSGLDACDCLNNNCVGCHFPCLKCNNPKCGNECRRNRNDFTHAIQYDGKMDDTTTYNNNFMMKMGKSKK